MITVLHGPLISRPETWVLAFARTAASPWVRWLVWGRYKHVRAYGYVPFLHVWLFYDATFTGIEVIVAADGEAARAQIAGWIDGCDLVRMPRRPHANASPVLAMCGWCVPAIKRLIGLRCGALRPDALYEHCLRNGGVRYGKQPSRTDVPAAADRGRAVEPGAAAGIHPATG